MLMRAQHCHEHPIIECDVEASGKTLLPASEETQVHDDVIGKKVEQPVKAAELLEIPAVFFNDSSC
jgi:hypothetical protein